MPTMLQSGDLRKSLYLLAAALAGLPAGWAFKDYGLIHLASAVIFAEALYFLWRHHRDKRSNPNEKL